MLIACSSAFIIILSLAAMLLPRPTLQSLNSDISSAYGPQSAADSASNGSEENLQNTTDSGRWRDFRESRLLLEKEGGEEGRPVDCCPSVLEMVEPKGGRNQEDKFVVLYREGKIRQRFYELSCRQDVENKPCRFIGKKLHNQSMCVQQFSYSYALVREPETLRHHHWPHHSPSFPSGGNNWMLDYIRVRSGCSCQLMPKVKKKHSSSSETKHL